MASSPSRMIESALLYTEISHKLSMLYTILALLWFSHIFIKRIVPK